MAETAPSLCRNCGHASPHTVRRGECPVCGCDAPSYGPRDDDAKQCAVPGCDWSASAPLCSSFGGLDGCAVDASTAS
jgi:hypothetical protein